MVIFHSYVSLPAGTDCHVSQSHLLSSNDWHDNGKCTIYRRFSQLQSPFIADYPFPCLITRGYIHVSSKLVVNCDTIHPPSRDSTPSNISNIFGLWFSYCDRELNGYFNLQINIGNDQIWHFSETPIETPRPVIMARLDWSPVSSPTLRWSVWIPGHQTAGLNPQSRVSTLLFMWFYTVVVHARGDKGALH